MISVPDNRVWFVLEFRAIAILTSLSAMLNGCIVIPQPHDSVHLSRVEGVLSNASSPVANAILTTNALTDDAKCENPIAQTESDAVGYFVFPEIKTRKIWRIAVLAPSSPTHSMTICLHDNGKARPIFDQRIWAVLPALLRLECELSSTSGNDDVCQVANWSGYNYLQGSEHYGECRPESPSGVRVLEGGNRVSCERN